MTAFLQQLPKLSQTHRTLSGVERGAAAWAFSASILHQMKRRKTRGGAWIVVVPEPDQAEAFTTDIGFFLQDAPDHNIYLFPPDDVRPWDGFSPNPSIPHQRIMALQALCDANKSSTHTIVVAATRALQHRVWTRKTLRALRLHIQVGQVIERDALISDLSTRGYLITPTLDEPGTASRRGDIVDIWPPTHQRDSNPIRIEFFDNEIERIAVVARKGHPEKKPGIPIEDLTELTLLPLREAVLVENTHKRAAQSTAKMVDQLGEGQRTRRRLLQSLEARLWFPGAEAYLPAMHELGTLFAVNPQATRLLWNQSGIQDAGQSFEHLFLSRWNAIPSEDRPLVQPESRYLSANALVDELTEARHFTPLAPDVPDFGAKSNESLLITRGELAPVAARMDEWLQDGWNVALCAENQNRLERVSGLLREHGLVVAPNKAPAWGTPGSLTGWIGPLSAGFHCPVSKMAVVTADDIFGQKIRAKSRPKTFKEAALSSFSELKEGDLVVHVRHGVGRFVRLVQLDLSTGRQHESPTPQDFVEMEYRGGDRLYVPVTRLDNLVRYRSMGDRQPRLDKLGGESWERRKAKVRDQMVATAHELLQIHAMRALVTGTQYEGEPPLFRQFVETFPFIETPDQEHAIAEVMDDLAGPQPMDRLIVGDVGFGKTEIAMRAAMRVILGGRQVVMLCPTTVLAFQHFQTFGSRFDGFPVETALLTRFQTPSEKRSVLQRAKEGSIDLLIGTHALLNQQSHFARLGLVIVDEEHRFGVRQKERLKKLTEVGTSEETTEDSSLKPSDYLAMSATPIPRSLHMALTGLRSISMITTPPPGRREVRTRLMSWHDVRLRDQILSELGRGGQVFFIHNRVQSIEVFARRLRELIPEARIAVAHGQMPADQLENTLVEFVQGEFHVLVCTTIIESGVDMPNVNTIIINRAHELGLAQLYQLRGRVGRATRRGYCSLLVPDEDDQTGMTRRAVRRLQVLLENTQLGAGFAIASADLELRGSGQLLGDAQHGHIQAVGLETYAELLEEAVAMARGDITRTRLDPELEIPLPALLPETYIEEMSVRLAEYRRMATTKDPAEARGLLDEWEERYGPAPEEVLNLGWMAEARANCRALGIIRLNWLQVRVVLEFHETTVVPPERIVALVSEHPNRFSLASAKTSSKDDSTNTRVVVRFTPEEGERPFRFLYWVFRQLQDDS